MPTPGRLGPRLLLSAAVSVLATCAAVLAHLVVADHGPGPAVLATVLVGLSVGDAVLGTVLRGTWAVAVRLTALQVSAHATLATAAAVTHGHPAESTGVPAGHHGAASALASGATAALLPSPAMLAAHALGAVAIALLLARTTTSGRAALDHAELVGAVGRWLNSLSAPLRIAPAVADVPAPADTPVAQVISRPRTVWTGVGPVRRGPPVPAA